MTTQTNIQETTKHFAEGKPSWNLSTEDRRKHRRFNVARPGKVFRRATQQFAAAQSRDLSFGGALLEVESPRLFNVGEIVELGLTLRGSAVVDSKSLVQGIVVRVRQVDPLRQSIAVRYINPGALKRAA